MSRNGIVDIMEIAITPAMPAQWCSVGRRGENCPSCCIILGES